MVSCSQMKILAAAQIISIALCMKYKKWSSNSHIPNVMAGAGMSFKNFLRYVMSVDHGLNIIDRY